MPRRIESVEDACRWTQEEVMGTPNDYWVDSSDTPTDGEVKESIEELMEECRVEVERVEDTLPFDADKVTIAFHTTLDQPGDMPWRTRYGCCTPVRCGYLDWSGDDWTVDEQPEHYVVHLSFHAWQKHRDLDTLLKTVRHELAHAADWEENLRTTEQTETHGVWLKRLDAPTTL